MLPTLQNLQNKQYTRKQLQEFAMRCGIRANSKNDILIDELTAYINASDIEIKQSRVKDEIHNSVILDKSQFEDSIEIPNQQPLLEFGNSPNTIEIEDNIFPEVDSDIKNSPQFVIQNELHYEQDTTRNPAEGNQVNLQELINIINEHREFVKKTLRRKTNEAVHMLQRKAAAAIAEVPKEVRAQIQ
ncbi:Conserved_hypothetical protein [Hexamita inflata]|uniref:SAP domain-containing protein n=1 Tax=Hexamita inflata TaxID=28002 RepID=A0ABP1IL15_9EUKA